MKYRASEIIKRSLQLADIANTDFLTYQEKVDYLNDAWKAVYQWLINKGDKQFVREVGVAASGGINGFTEFELPDDFYQMLSLKNPASGQLIPRKAESESSNSGTYEIVNNKLRLYGAGFGNLVLTYYYSPTFISFPDKDIDTSNIGNRTVLGSAGDSILLSDGTIINMKTGEVLGNITIEDNNTYRLGNGHVFAVGTKLNKAYYIDGTFYDSNMNIITEPEGTLESTEGVSSDTHIVLGDVYVDTATGAKSTTNLVYYEGFRTGGTSADVTLDAYGNTWNNVIYPKVDTNEVRDGNFISKFGGSSRWLLHLLPADDEYYAVTNEIKGSTWDEPTRLGTDAAHIIDATYADATLTTLGNAPILSTSPAWFSDVADWGIITLGDDDYVGFKDSDGYYHKFVSFSSMANNPIVSPSGLWKFGEGSTVETYYVNLIDGRFVEFETSDETDFDTGSVAMNIWTVGNTLETVYNTNPGSTINNHTEIVYYLLKNQTNVSNSPMAYPTSYERIDTQLYTGYSWHKVESIDGTTINTNEFELNQRNNETEADIIYECVNNSASNLDLRTYEQPLVRYLSFDNEVVYSEPLSSDISSFIDTNYNVYWWDSSVLKLFGNVISDEVNSMIINAPYTVNVDDNKLIVNDIEYEMPANIGIVFPTEDFGGKPAFYVGLSDLTVYLASVNNDGITNLDKVDLVNPLKIMILKYGVLTSNGTGSIIESGIPDTMLDFPNELYFSLIACDLALRYAMKQNADCQGLQALYQSMQYQFMDSLSQDASYTRIKNVYR